MSRRISYLLLLIALAIVFKKFFLPGPLVWGDAPYFYKEGFKELISIPSLWTTRGNTFGGANLFIWIYPLMFIYGVLGNFLHLGNDVILRLLFYFPSLIFGFSGIYLFTKHLKLSNTITFFASLIYLINTHLLLIADGGQVGLFLAYGLFPFVLYQIIKFTKLSSVKNFLITLISAFALTVVDFRISAICLLAAFLFKLFRPKDLAKILLIAVCILGLSGYWIIPALNLPLNAIETGVSGLQTTSFLNSFFLFSPNWPANQFGQITPPYFYFALVPILIFSGAFLKNKKEFYYLSLMFLVFAFLSKGTTPPIGNLYNLLINTKIGSVFRDSTKFFIPLTLFAGVLIGLSVEQISKKFKSNNLKLIFQISVYLYILFLIWQGLFGKLNGVLGKNPNVSDFQKVYQYVSNDNYNFERTAWFTEKSPFAFHTESKQSLDAKDLVNFRPFAAMNVGTGDRFNFVNNPNYLDWFDLFGIRYLILSGNPRMTNLPESDIKDWDRLTNLLANDKRLQKANIDTIFPVYQNPSIHPNKFFVDKSFVVIGSDNIYEKLKVLDQNFSVSNSGFLFLEDGKLDPALLQNVATTSAVLIFNNKTKDDLKMSFLEKYFVAPTSSVNSQWSIFTSNDYLKYKYELLTRNIKFDDFDYNLGIAFSTIKGEKIDFNLDVPLDGDYFLAIRNMDKDNQNMHWDYIHLNNLKKGIYHYSQENKNGVEILNAIALIPKNEMANAESLANNFIGLFQNYDISNKQDTPKLTQIIKSVKWENLQGLTIDKNGWIIFTDTFNPKWELQNRFEEVSPSLPMYSSINGFYVDPKWSEPRIFFKGEDDLRWGIYITGLSVLLIMLGLLGIKAKNVEKN